MKQKVIGLISVFAIVSCFFFMPFVKAETLQEKKDKNDKNKQEAEQKLEYVQGELTDSLVKIQELDDKIRTAENEIQTMTTQLTSLQTEIEQTTENLKTVEQRYEANRTMMEKRMVVMYECGDISYLDLLLHSSNLVDFLSNYYTIAQIMESDNETLEEIEKEKNEIETVKSKLENKKSELKLLKVKQEQTRVIMQNNKTAQQNAIDRLSEEEQQLQTKIQEYKDEEQRLQNLIRLASSTYVYNGQYTGGSMRWPVAVEGTCVTSDFGLREHPIQGVIKGHTGIDIGNADFGSPIVAAADGIVSLASYYGGYGNCVMINHGNGISTLYGHGQKILTEVGKEVKAGDVIMEVGSTGVSTGPHCHFEVRINGNPVNPWPYLGITDDAETEDTQNKQENVI